MRDIKRLILSVRHFNNPPQQSLSPVPQVCDWCKHVRHTKEYLDFGSGEERLQFCSTKCLNQYKMDVFYREARAALTSSSPSRPGHEGRSDGVGTGQKLLTPESWNSSGGSGGAMGEATRKNLSPKAPHGSAESASNPSSEVPFPGPKVHVAGLRNTERPLQPPPHPASADVPHHPAPLHAPPPARPSVEHQPLPQIPMPFIRPPLHAQGLKSPLANQSRHPAAPSSPIHRPAHSPHLQPPTSSSMNPPGMMHPFPGAYFPGLHSPPITMMPRGPIPMPPMMNFPFPSFSPLLPQPTVLVPYPIIVPLPVPIPIPIPIPVPSKEAAETPSHAGVIQPVPEGADRCRFRAARLPSPGVLDSENRFAKLPGSTLQGQSLPSPGDPSTKDTDWIKSERSFPTLTSAPHSGASSPRAQHDTSPTSQSEPLPDLKHQQSERQVIQRVLPRTQEKQGVGTNGAVDLSGLGDSGTPQDSRTGHHEVIRPVLALPSSPSHDPAPHRQDSHAPAPHSSPTRSAHPYTGANMASQDLNPNSPSAPHLPDSSLLQRVPASSSDPTLSELEAIKENKCSAVGPVGVEGLAGQSEEPLAVLGEVGRDPHVPDEDHAYALPTAPKTGGSATPLLLPKLRDKGSLRSAAIPGAGDMEPALKRRCLRIRDQNK